jgi:hypothetical protein
MKGNNMANKSSWASVRHALLGLLLAACGGAVGASSVGGESHFLRHCGDGCGSGLDCIADLCTRGCVVAQDSCGDLDEAATCTADSIEPGAIAVCDAPCASNAACSSLGADFTCQSGFCREEPPSLPGGSAGATQGGSAGASPGGSAGASQSGAAGAPMTPAPGGAGPGPVWTPPSRCQQAFDIGPCDASIPVFAYDNGRCEPKTYGGCEGNDNRFSTIEECISVCEGAPTVNACPEGRVRQQICIACGPAGGCGVSLDACAQPCQGQSQCASGSFSCASGVCQADHCI